jgi:hypothetical protein
MCLILTLLAVPVFHSLWEDLGEQHIWGPLARTWRRTATNTLRPLPSPVVVEQRAGIALGSSEESR